MRINDILVEFAADGGGDSGNYFQSLASAWYNGTFDTGSLQKGIKSQQDVERLLNRGIVCPDGKTRKLHIDYNSDFDGVEIYSDDYYEYGDHDDTIDSRTGQKWGPYDFMAFSDEDLSEGINEFAADDGNDGGEDDALRNYAKMWWAGDEATQQQIEKVLARMGWEIGEDEGGYDNGGVFVVRAGDANGDSYVSWAAEDLSEGWKKGAAIGGTLGAIAGGPMGAAIGAATGAGLQHNWDKEREPYRKHNPEQYSKGQFSPGFTETVKNLSKNNSYESIVAHYGEHGKWQPKDRDAGFTWTDHNILHGWIFDAMDNIDEKTPGLDFKQVYPEAIKMAAKKLKSAIEGKPKIKINPGETVPQAIARAREQGTINEGILDSVKTKLQSLYQSEVKSNPGFARIFSKVQQNKPLIDKVINDLKQQQLKQKSKLSGDQITSIIKSDIGSLRESNDPHWHEIEKSDQALQTSLADTGKSAKLGFLTYAIGLGISAIAYTENHSMSALIALAVTLAIGWFLEQEHKFKKQSSNITIDRRNRAYKNYYNSIGQEPPPDLPYLTKESVEQGMAEGYTDDDIETTRQFKNAIAGLKARSAIDKAKDGPGAKYYYDGAKVTPQETARRAAERKAKKDKKGVAEGAPISGDGGAVDNFKQQMANNTELAYQKDMAEGNRKSEPPEADYGADYQDMVKRVKRLAGLGPLKTQYDPNRRVYKNMPTAVQPKK